MPEKSSEIEVPLGKIPVLDMGDTIDIWQKSTCKKGDIIHSSDEVHFTDNYFIGFVDHDPAQEKPFHIIGRRVAMELIEDDDSFVTEFVVSNAKLEKYIAIRIQVVKDKNHHECLLVEGARLSKTVTALK